MDPYSDPDHFQNSIISSFYLFRHILKISSNPSISFLVILYTNTSGSLDPHDPDSGPDYSHKLANLISKLNFYKLIPYPMDNCFTGRRDRSRQTTEKVILYKIPAGPVTECTFARCRLVHTSCLVRMTSSRLFSLSKPIRPLVS